MSDMLDPVDAADVLRDTVAILRRKPWFILWPIVVVVWVLRDDDPPWWLRFDLSGPDDETHQENDE